MKMSEIILSEQKQVVFDKAVTALDVFGSADAAESILNYIKEQVKNVPTDVSTEENMAKIRSAARKVASSKTLIDEMGLGLTKEWRDKTALVNAERKRLAAELQSLQDEVRRPLTEYENAKVLRESEREDRIKEIFS